MSPELRATYRIQLHRDFGFSDAAAITDYLAELGISHLYCSPYLQAAGGSTHGYDVVNPQQVNRELGGPDGHARLCAALEDVGLKQVLDIVPNHMAIRGRENPWWWDVLENGPSSRYAAYFDVDWDPPEAKLRNTVLLPVLGDHYGRVLEKPELALQREGGQFIIRYHDHVFPVSPRSLDELIADAARRCDSDDLAFIAEALRQLPPSTATDWAAVQRRHRNKEVLRRMLARLCEEQPQVAGVLDQTIAEINTDADQLDALLERQNYRLAFWRTAGRELGYRRFFDINTLVGLRAEDERVFADTHALILDWLAGGVLDGVRVDHPDGLRDPEQYFDRLHTACPGAWITAEKILEPGERLPESWPIAGTTGYDFICRVNNLLVDREAETALTRFYGEFTGETTDFAALVREKKQFVLREILASDLNRLTALLVDICERHRRHRDYTRHELHEALRELIASFPIYRTYVRAEAGVITDDDAGIINRTIDDAKERRPDLDGELFDFFRAILLLRHRGQLETEWVMRLQQLTGPVMAKGLEDTAFYCFNRLVSLNEVGGDPGRFGLSPDEFHAACAEAQARWPRTMLASSTHDTKRSEDVRARINLLSEIPERWMEAVGRWAELNAGYRREGFPDRNTEYLIYQTLVGAWPIEVDRVLAYMEKAAREAKIHTSWTDPNPIYDDALQAFVEGIMNNSRFRESLESFVRPLIEPGRINSLAQTLIKLTAPGIPDFYQGTELWDLSLVDPDNRRPVDYQLRRRLLAEMKCMSPEQIWAKTDDGAPKLWLIRQTLRARQERQLFQPQDSYRALMPSGSKRAHVIAFARNERAITIVPRLPLKLAGDWGDTAIEIPDGRWRNHFTNETLNGGVGSVAKLLKRFPVALLLREEEIR
ncbi:MAG TPA: malto-oligosyltrehalose synthase [Candidatus Polarisedimenticolaceae bacterium]|nr:malto-oligosyltrehalose synthase [Candidatus Polarisedimenticolaceae bacterium]